MKKNLRIVSVAAAALLAVAPVAATAMPVNAATTINADSAINANTNAKYDVDVTPSISAIAAVAKSDTMPAIPGSLTGSISASYNGKSYTANLPKDSGNATITDSNNNTVKPAELEADKAYTVTVPDVSFNFGSENAGKEITIGSANPNVTFTEKTGDQPASTVKVTLDQDGVAKLSSVQIKNVYAIDTTYNSNVNFYDVTTGATVTTGAVSIDADNQGQLNITSVVAAINSKYFAAQYDKKQLTNVTFDTETAVKDALKAQKIEVSSVGYFKAPHTFTVNVKATSNKNGKSATLPVTVTVPNVADPVVPSQSKTIMHNAYFYDKDAKRVGTDKVTRYNTVTVAMNTTKLANGISYYEVIENGKATGKYINADNIDGTKRTLKHNAYVYKTSKKRANKVVLKKGTEVTTYGGSYKFKNGQRYYKIGANTEKTYVKVANFE
ncbi:S-layer protein SlpH [Lactobacillus helveticus]|uniref:S-layer protein n=1 Tax=Lactobacillus helveticus TaxID=1587 RepID=Q9S3A0_LACHE|nr:S-layer protein SlpH [Lactobacillus helveticus]ASS83145.1 surface layer protein [Lactobacillus helveticus]NRO49833.1 S-layer protein [Lactobacillus helveticus]NRO67521.1 S-layer protein [Lactobacillus helveticus]NRO70877.1 S-layer protein [Lactobacillus helveticus]CAB46984.1 surface layer protein [Lactobacillus helveticus]